MRFLRVATVSGSGNEAERSGLMVDKNNEPTLAEGFEGTIETDKLCCVTSNWVNMNIAHPGGARLSMGALRGAIESALVGSNTRGALPLDRPRNVEDVTANAASCNSSYALPRSRRMGAMTFCDLLICG